MQIPIPVYPFVLVLDPQIPTLIADPPAALQADPDTNDHLGDTAVFFNAYQANGKLNLTLPTPESRMCDLEYHINAWLNDLPYYGLFECSYQNRRSYRKHKIKEVLDAPELVPPDGWYHKYLFVCPFAMVWDDENFQYVEGVNGLTLMVYDCNRVKLDRVHRKRLQQLNTFRSAAKSRRYPARGLLGSHHFYSELHDAALFWVDALQKEAEQKWPRADLQAWAAECRKRKQFTY